MSTYLFIGAFVVGLFFGYLIGKVNGQMQRSADLAPKTDALRVELAIARESFDRVRAELDRIQLVRHEAGVKAGATKRRKREEAAVEALLPPETS